VNVVFLAKVPSVGFAVYDVQPADRPAAAESPLSVTDSTLQNARYRIRVDANGDLASVFDKRLGRELLAPQLVAPETHAEMVGVQFAGIDGVLPDYGRFSPLDWGLGVEVKGAKEGHWSGNRTSPRTFGHFGGSGTFLWVDPELGIACAALTTREFGDWAKAAWPRLSDAVVDELR